VPRGPMPPYKEKSAKAPLLIALTALWRPSPGVVCINTEKNTRSPRAGCGGAERVSGMASAARSRQALMSITVTIYRNQLAT